LIERTEENDYGVMSDPDEHYNSSPTPLLTKEPPLQEEEMKGAAGGDDHGPNCTPSEQMIQQHLLQPSSPSSQQLDLLLEPSIPPSIQSQIPQIQSSLTSLELRLTTDKNFSKKITLHTFFSYLILAIELYRTSSSSSSPNLSTISLGEINTLVDYMIENHCASEEIRTYLGRLNENGIITNMITAIIEFNAEEKDSFDKLVQSEQIEIELERMNAARDENSGLENTSQESASLGAEKATATTATTATTAAAAAATTTPTATTGLLKRLRRFFSGCCG
jgi:hypothetical protein